MQNIDLHNHSRISDGLLTPAELVGLAARNGVTGLALTDHDNTAGLGEAQQAAQDLGIGFIPGVEISVTWEQHTLHIVGLAIDPEYPPLSQGLAGIRSGRQGRAQRVADSLAGAGIAGALEGALRYAVTPECVSRTHFARFLVERGMVRNVPAVFKRFLVKGKPGYVRHVWAPLADALAWIQGAGGLAVLAHPGRYSIGATDMNRLLDEFTDLGGRAIEVMTANHTREQVDYFAAQSLRRGLLASRGSDYHGPGESRLEPGRIPPLPDTCVPVWQALDFSARPRSLAH